VILRTGVCLPFDIELRTDAPRNLAGLADRKFERKQKVVQNFSQLNIRYRFNALCMCQRFDVTEKDTKAAACRVLLLCATVVVDHRLIRHE
jgi:hypothetical protein